MNISTPLINIINFLYLKSLFSLLTNHKKIQECFWFRKIDYLEFILI